MAARGAGDTGGIESRVSELANQFARNGRRSQAGHVRPRQNSRSTTTKLQVFQDSPTQLRLQQDARGGSAAASASWKGSVAALSGSTPLAELARPQPMYVAPTSSRTMPSTTDQTVMSGRPLMAKQTPAAADSAAETAKKAARAPNGKRAQNDCGAGTTMNTCRLTYPTNAASQAGDASSMISRGGVTVVNTAYSTTASRHAAASSPPPRRTANGAGMASVPTPRTLVLGFRSKLRLLAHK